MLASALYFYLPKVGDYNKDVPKHFGIGHMLSCTRIAPVLIHGINHNRRGLKNEIKSLRI